MAANGLKVNTGEIDTAVSTIRNKADDYKTAYQAVFNQFTKIDAAWEGDDNQEFHDRVITFKNDFEAMDTFFEKLVAFLEKASKDYKQAETDTKAEAQKLAR